MPAPHYVSNANTVQGVLDNASVNVLKQVRDVTKELTLVTPDNDDFALVSLLTTLPKSGKATNVKKEWFRKRQHIRKTTIGSTSITNNGSAAITAPISDLNAVRFGYKVVVIQGSNEYHAIVTSVSSPNAILTFYDGTTPTLAAGNHVEIHGDVSEGWSTLPESINAKVEEEYNQVMLSRHSFKVDFFERNTEQYTGPEINERIQELRREAMIALELQTFWGERGSRTGSNGTMQYFMRGWVKYVVEDASTTNVLNMSGGFPTEAAFDEFMLNGPLKYGGSRKFMYVSNSFWMHMRHNWNATKERLQIGNGSRMIAGAYYNEYQGPNGKRVFIKQHHLFDEAREGSFGIVDPMFLKLEPFGDFPMFGMLHDREANDQIGTAKEIVVCTTLINQLPESCGWGHM